MQPSQRTPPDSGTEWVNAARVHDYYLDGVRHHEADRKWADVALEQHPRLALKARAHRDFLGRVVRFCVEMGLRQFLELGSGLPSGGQVHEVAAELEPDCRVVYVDRDPEVVAQSRTLLAGHLRSAVVQADLRSPEQVFAAPEVRHLLDVQEPVGVLMVSVLQYVDPGEDPGAVLADYHRRVAVGSYLAVSHPGPVTTPDIGVNPEALPACARSGAELEGMLGSFRPVAPGVVQLPMWRPGSVTEFELDPERYQSLAVVGRKNG